MTLHAVIRHEECKRFMKSRAACNSVPSSRSCIFKLISYITLYFHFRRNSPSLEYDIINEESHAHCLHVHRIHEELVITIINIPQQNHWKSNASCNIHVLYTVFWISFKRIVIYEYVNIYFSLLIKKMDFKLLSI